MRRGRIRGSISRGYLQEADFFKRVGASVRPLHNPVAGGLRVSLACVVILLLVMDLHDFYTVNGKNIHGNPVIQRGGLGKPS